MNTIKNLFFACSMLFASLDALDVATELHMAQDLPQEFKNKVHIGKYFTIINFKDWPANHSVEVFEERVANEKRTKLGVFKTTAEYGLTQLVGAIGYLPGEQTTFTFKDSNKKITEKVTIVPYPIIAESKTDNAKINVIMDGLSSYRVVFTGFKKDEQLTFESVSYDESMKHSLQFKTDMAIGYMPQVKGREGGVAKFSVTRPSGEVLKVEIPWGLELSRYLVYYDSNGNPRSILEDKELPKKDPKMAKYFKLK